MNLLWIDFIYILMGILMVKIGYLMVFNNLFYVLSQKPDSKNKDYRVRFGGLAGKVLGTIGFFTLLLTVGRRYFPDTYLVVYLLIVSIAMIFLVIRYMMIRNEALKEMDFHEE